MRPHSEEGFTLLEVILALVLTGLLAAMAGTGVVSGFNVFMAARDNVHITQKANLALTRLTRELREITNVAAYSDAPYWLIYDGPQGRRAVARDAGTIKLYDLADGTTNLTAADISSNGDILIDGVDNFTLNCSNGGAAWTTAQSIRRLSTIAFQITIGRDSMGGRTSAFENTVHLRNNNNFGGAGVTLPVTPPTQSDYCFIGAMNKEGAAVPWLALLALLLLPLPYLWQRPQARRRIWLPRPGTEGAALIIVIVVLIVFSTLAVVMLPMITATQYTQLGQDTAAKTYYLAESGYRYAASQYLNAASEPDKNTSLENLHGQTFTLSGTAGSFELNVFPYYGYVQTDPNNTATLVVRVPGGLSPDLDATAFSGGGRLLIGAATYQFSSATLSDPDITYTMTTPVPSTPVNTTVYFMARSSNASQTVTMDGTIDMESGGTRRFPPQNAEVVINGNVYAYRTNDRANSRLIGITDPENTATMPALTIPPNTTVQLSKYVDLQSTGSHGSGHLASERLLTYHVPLPGTEHAQRRIEFHDTFDNLSHWTPDLFGTQVVESIDGDNALRMDTVSEWIMNLPRVSMAALDWTATPIDLRYIHERANYYLSYDAQVKIGYLGTPTPDEPAGREFTPPGSTIPTYFAAGLNFRLDSTATSHNSYGLSFMRGLNAPPL